jgi:hypothetical protein
LRNDATGRRMVDDALDLAARKPFPEVGGLHHRYERRAA